MYTPTRIAGREAVVEFLPEKLRAYRIIYIDRGNKQTDRQTYAGDYIIPRESFRGDNYRCQQDIVHIHGNGQGIPEKYVNVQKIEG